MMTADGSSEDPEKAERRRVRLTKKIAKSAQKSGK